MCEIKASIELIDKFIALLGDRKKFQQAYSKALSKSMLGDISLVRSELFRTPNYLGALLFEDIAAVLLLFQQTGIIHYDNLEKELAKREQNEGSGLWTSGYNEDEDCIIRFLDYTNYHHADEMNLMNDSDWNSEMSDEWIGECRTENYAKAWQKMTKAEKARFLSYLERMAKLNFVE